jgi:hypothetical protein
MSTQFDHTSVVKKSNIFFDGKCISHTVILADGSKKSVGLCCQQKSSTQQHKQGVDPSPTLVC